MATDMPYHVLALFDMELEFISESIGSIETHLLSSPPQRPNQLTGLIDLLAKYVELRAAVVETQKLFDLKLAPTPVEAPPNFKLRYSEIDC